MAEPQATATPCGLLHVRARHTKNFTILPNQLIQRTGSAVTAGVAAFLFSLRDGTPVSIDRLCAHFKEGRTRISQALTELEHVGYLERRTERAPDGTIRTRAILYDQPGAGSPVATADVPRQSRRPAARPGPKSAGHPSTASSRRHTTVPRPRSAPPATPVPRTAAVPVEAPSFRSVPAPCPPSSRGVPSPTDVPDPSHPGALSPSGTPAAPAPEPSPHTPRALAVLAGLRSTDPRLCLSEGELHALAPEAARWLDRRASSDEICRALTSGLPAHFTGRPFHLLRYRLRTYLPPRPNGSPPSARGTASAAPAPLRTCAGCDKVAFRSAEHTHCSTCRAAPPLTPVST